MFGSPTAGQLFETEMKPQLGRFEAERITTQDCFADDNLPPGIDGKEFRDGLDKVLDQVEEQDREARRVCGFDDCHPETETCVNNITGPGYRCLKAIKPRCPTAEFSDHLQDLNRCTKTETPDQLSFGTASIFLRAGEFAEVADMTRTYNYSFAVLALSRLQNGTD